MDNDFFRELELAQNLARKAGYCILEIRKRGDSLQIHEKTQDNQPPAPVTIADLRSNDLICQGLNQGFPEYGLLSEEMIIDESHWWEKKRLWIIDPLDGTEDFIRGGIDFGIHIGLLENDFPVLGVNYYPARNVMYWAIRGQGAYKQVLTKDKEKLSCIKFKNENIYSLRSKSDELSQVIYNQLSEKGGETIAFTEYIASTGLRLCLIAEGIGNLYVTSAKRGGLWDFLSGNVIIAESGGILSDWKGHSIDYRNPSAKLPQGIIACSDSEILKHVLVITEKI